MIQKRSLLALGLTLFTADVSAIGAQSKDLSKIRSIGQPLDSIPLGMSSTPSIRVLSNGRVFATDIFSRRLIMIAEDMKSIDVVFDASSPPPLTYPQGFVPLVAGLGDSTLFYDNGARGYRVIDPNGRVVRRQSIADPSLTRALSYPAAPAVVDPKGRIVIATQRSNFNKTVPGIQPQAESLMVMRVVLERQGYDSLAAIMGSGQHTVVMDSTRQPPLLMLVTSVVDRGDAWVMTSNGTIAIVRGADFHVDWIDPDGARRSSPPVPWQWAKYSKADRDSMMAARESMMNAGNMRAVSSTGAVTTGATPPPRKLDSIPERVPAFAPATARADLDGRIWIELGARVMGPPSTLPSVFAIIDSTGRVVERLELPARRTIAGFDRLGYLYTVTAGRGGYVLERYPYRAP